jgi:hypothetical protein
MAEDEAVARYRFGPLERRGLVAGWRGGQIATVSAGLLFAVLVLRGHPSLAGVAGAVLLVALAVGAATWPIAGRTAEEWAPDALRFSCSTMARRNRPRGSPFATLQLLGVEDGGEWSMAVVHDTAARTYTAVLRAKGTGFVLLGAQEKTARVSAWSTVLASLGRPGSALYRLQWLARCLPDDGAALRRHWESKAVLDPASPAQRSYAALLDTEATSARTHEVLLALTVDAAKAGRAVRAAGGGHAGACTVVARETAWLRRQLADCGVDVGEVLDGDELSEVVRGSFGAQPRSDVERRVSERGRPPSHRDGVPALSRRDLWPWPMAMEGEWGRVRADDTWHVTYWIAEWPRRDVGPEFLGPLLLADVRQSVSLVMEPVAAAEAARRIEQARTADIADAELRRRGGFLSSARRRREEEVLVHRERELADGHAQYRFSGYVTVTAGDGEELEDACARTEQAAGRAGLDLRRCYGDQARALGCTLPLGRGLA